MGNPARQWQLRWQNVTVNLNGAPYTVLSASGGGASGGVTLEIEVRVEDASAAAVDRHVALLRRLVRAGEVYSDEQSGGALYVYYKRCDDVDVVAEVGATWRRVRVARGSVLIAQASAPYLVQTVRLSLELADDCWRRATPSPVLSGSTAVSARTDGGVTATGVALTARRQRWTAATGVTARYHWLYGAANCTFFKVTTNCRAWWDEAAKRFKMQDNAATVAQSSTYGFTVGQEVEVVFRWQPGVGLGIFVNGYADGAAGACNFTDADPYTLFEPTGVQSLLNVQVWPAALTDAQCQGLAAWGRPEAELPFFAAPANTKNTNQAFRLYNTPGEVVAPLRVLLSDASLGYDRFRLGLRRLRTPPSALFEIEGAVLGAGTATAADTTASGGVVARVTPADANWTTRATLTVAQDADDLAPYFGEHHLYLAARDLASAPGTNVLRWRLVLAGVAEDWSAEVSLAAINTYSLLDLGRLSLPPGAWPDESEGVTSDVYGGVFATLEIQTRNTIGSGGGALDLDALYMTPGEHEVTATATSLAVNQFLVLDWLSRQAAAVVAADWRQMEFAGWADMTGELGLAPGPGAGSLLWLFAYRNTVETAYPNDTVTVQLQLAPGWVVG